MTPTEESMGEQSDIWGPSYPSPWRIFQIVLMLVVLFMHVPTIRPHAHPFYRRRHQI
jgi:hypothetical protein